VEGGRGESCAAAAAISLVLRRSGGWKTYSLTLSTIESMTRAILEGGWPAWSEVSKELISAGCRQGMGHGRWRPRCGILIRGQRRSTRGGGRLPPTQL
jgi:hypothetical protein